MKVVGCSEMIFVVGLRSLPSMVVLWLDYSEFWAVGIKFEINEIFGLENHRLSYLFVGRIGMSRVSAAFTLLNFMSY